MQTYKWLCPFECSHLEPLCIHRYTQTYTYFILQILLCMTPCCANSHMSVPFRVLTVRTSLYTCIYSEVYIITNTIFYVNPCCANSHMSVPLRVLALRTSLHTYMCSQVYIYSITDTFVHGPMLCKLTCVCNLASAHACNVIVYTGLYIHILTSIHISRIISRIRWYINLCCALSHVFVPL